MSKPQGNGPSPALSPADTWTQLTALPRPHRVVDFPRKGPDGATVGQIAIVTLTQGESMSATNSTERVVKKLMKEEGGAVPGSNEKSEGYTTLFENRAAIEVLFRACKKPDDLDKPFFPTIEAIAKHLTVDEIGVLMNLYNIVREEIGPIVSRMSEEEMDAWIDRLVQGGRAADPLALLTLAARTDLLIYMADQCSRSQTDSSSHTTPQ